MTSFSWDLFNELPIIGILRGYSVELSLGAATAAVHGGLRNVEVTMNIKLRASPSN